MLACTAARMPYCAAQRPARLQGYDRRKQIDASACEVELDIFSGMPNPTWILTNAEADSFVKQLAGCREPRPENCRVTWDIAGSSSNVRKGLTRS